MSLYTQVPQTPTTKTAHLEYPFEDIPSSLDAALNGHGSTLKPPEPSEGMDAGLLDPDTFRRLSFSTISGLSDDGRLGHTVSVLSQVRCASRSPAPLTTWHATFQHFWQRNRGLWLVTISQFFGALMNVTTRLLELEGEGMHPFQVLFARMGITMVFCVAYMWYTKVPYFPLGMKEVRLLLVVRGLTGFFGIFGMYCRYSYLSFSAFLFLRELNSVRAYTFLAMTTMIILQVSEFICLIKLTADVWCNSSHAIPILSFGDELKLAPIL
jgi:hypothetical protein